MEIRLIIINGEVNTVKEFKGDNSVEETIEYLKGKTTTKTPKIFATTTTVGYTATTKLPGRPKKVGAIQKLVNKIKK
jgi:acetyl-CoA carboxylase alpha subunit